MKKNRMVIAASLVLAACAQRQGPSDDQILRAAKSEVTRFNNEMCLSVGLPRFSSSLPMDNFMVLPSQPDRSLPPGVQEKVVQQLQVLTKAGLMSTEPATYATEDGVFPATRYRFTEKGEAALSQGNFGLSGQCLSAGHLEATGVQPLAPGLHAFEQPSADADPVAIRTVNVIWKDKPEWLDSPEGQLAFAGHTPAGVRATERGVKVTLFQGRTGKWHERRAGSDLSDVAAKAPVPLQDSEAELIHKADLLENSGRVPHDELMVPITLTDTEQFKSELGDGIFIADKTPPRPATNVTSPLKPTLYLRTITPEQRNEAREFFETLTKAGVITRKASSEVSARLPKGWVYYVPAESDAPGYRRAPVLDLGTFTLGQHATINSEGGLFLKASIPFTLNAPPAWLVEAAKQSPYFARLAKGGFVDVSASIRDGHYDLSSVTVRGARGRYY